MKKKSRSSMSVSPLTFLTGSLVTVAFVVALDAMFLQASSTGPYHAAPPSYAVCHAVTKGDSVEEQYFCSTQGCYSDDEYEVTVVGSYEDASTCSGIAETLQSGANQGD